MATTTELLGLGVPPAVATTIGYALQDTVTAAGSTQGTATPLTGSFVNVTTAGANTGVLLPYANAQPTIAIVNNGINALKVYPSGTERVNGGTGGAAYQSIAVGKGCLFVACGNQWVAVQSA